MGNGTTIDQQIKAVEDEVKMYASRMTWHDHQKALEDAAESLKNIKKIREDLKKLRVYGKENADDRKNRTRPQK